MSKCRGPGPVNLVRFKGARYIVHDISTAELHRNQGWPHIWAVKHRVAEAGFRVLARA